MSYQTTWYRKESWDLESARRLVGSIEPVAKRCGLHVGMAGSVLHKGGSKDDLDLVVFPLQTKKDYDFRKFQDELDGLGFAAWFDCSPYHPDDEKFVVSCFFNFSRRVDWFLFCIAREEVDICPPK